MISYLTLYEEVTDRNKSVDNILTFYLRNGANMTPEVFKQGIEIINRDEMAAKRPVVQGETTFYPWEDQDLMPLLIKGLPHYYERSDAGDKEGEKLAVGLANMISNSINKRESIALIEDEITESLNKTSGYSRNRLFNLAYDLMDSAKIKKGLLISGEGGIGKTFFLYSVAEELKKNNADYVIVFRDSGFKRLLQLPLVDIPNNYPNGFTIIIDACNELSDQIIESLFELIPSILAMPKVSIIVSTRSGSPNSHENELIDLLPAKRVFLGVNSDEILSCISDYSEAIFFQFQDMLFSNNPRNLHALKSKIEKITPQEDGLSAHTQRTTLIEACVKEQMNNHFWRDTKKICMFLYENKKTCFTLEEADAALNTSSKTYLDEMISVGFISSSRSSGEPFFFFSSESQMQYLVARSLNNDLDSITFREDDLAATTQEIAELVSTKVSSINEHEMCQVAVDRYCDKGAAFVILLIKALQDANLVFGMERLLRETVFLSEADFTEVYSLCTVDPAYALLKFGGYLNTPFNLTNYSNELLRNNPEIMIEFNKKYWRNWEVGELSQRVKNISSYVAYRGDIGNSAIHEWLWLSIWVSSSTNRKLRTWGQRLMFVLCDTSSNCMVELLSLWDERRDTYTRRAIAKTLSKMQTPALFLPEIIDFIDRVMDDPEVVDSIVLSYLADATKGRRTIADACSRNLYLELSEPPAPEELLKDARDILWRTDLFIKDYFPFEVSHSGGDFVNFNRIQSFLDVQKEAIIAWNKHFKEQFNCPKENECIGLHVGIDQAEELAPFTFKTKDLNTENFTHVFSKLLDKTFKLYGGNLKNGLGEYEVYGYDHNEINKPDLKPIDEAVGQFVGSLASNYYTNQILMNNPPYGESGFAPYEENCYQEPGIVHTLMPINNSLIDEARIKLEQRINTPVEKVDTWFDDIESAFSEITELLKPIKRGKSSWQPLAFIAKSRINGERGLLCSNEFFVSVAYDSNKSLKNNHDDRYLTIEHTDYLGNIADYASWESSLCAKLSKPDYVSNDRLAYPILLPPSNLVRDLNLQYVPKIGTFVDATASNPTIICDGNARNYYEDPVIDLMLMKNDVFQELVAQGKIKFFAFTERYHQTQGYRNDCDRHWEFKPEWEIISTFSNHKGISGRVESEECCECFFSDGERAKRLEAITFDDADWLKELKGHLPKQNEEAKLMCSRKGRHKRNCPIIAHFSKFLSRCKNRPS